MSLSKVMILMLAQLIEYYIEKVIEERFGCLKANFSLLHWQGDSLAYSMLITAFILYDSMVTQNLGLRLGPKAWVSI